MKQLKQDLSAHVPAATMDSHRIWLAKLITLSDHILHLVIFVLVLLALTIAFTVIYTTRSSLRIHESVIKLVHMMGAKDFYITNRYSFYNCRQAFLGSFVGALVTIPVFWVILMFFQKTDIATIQIHFSPLQLGILIMIPFGIGILTFVTTFKTVLSYLRRFL